MSTVLVADNDPGVRALLAEVVRREGLQVRTATDGEAARAELSSAPVDLFVCDLDMPRLTGMQVLHWLAAQPRRPAVIVVSGYLDPRIIAELDQLGCVAAVLHKPFDVFAFARLVRERVADRPPRAATAP